ncbi:glycosyltransferase [Aurantimonas sp. A3-2-R12]|uniref:glycosyltransferase n=1 Tax=Aurantimonas sp. A3-2-R12 TaxID=3114362 RepID=UPI002E194233|nr:glycosyltransferase [Aurantimonas sp. A3-2-R12]
MRRELERVARLRDDPLQLPSAYAAKPAVFPTLSLGDGARSPIRFPLSPKTVATARRSRQGLCEGVLAALGLDTVTIRAARSAAKRNGTDLLAEIVAGGAADAQTVAAAMAEALDVPFDGIAPGNRIIGAERCKTVALPRLVKTCDDELRTKLFLLPKLEGLDRTAEFLWRWPEVKDRARVTTEADVKSAMARQSERQRLDAAVLSLAAEQPRQSARTVLEAGQAIGLMLAFGLLLLALFSAPGATVAILHPLAGVLFAACLTIRLAAAISRQPPPADAYASSRSDEPPPLYSVLVALYHEAAMVDRLVRALSKLDWPVSRIEIKLICEGDDAATIRAVERAIAGHPQFEVVVIPACEPRTKPKALNYALPLTAGEFLVLYDAEDEPDPGQLREAFGRFRQGPANLVCLQAPLVVRNGANNWLAGIFALEYAALFRRLLPWLSGHGFPVPLGGTSNHFVRSRLIEIGGWDSHNVTEDADLGMRFYRAGYRVETLSSPTMEDAPERWAVWHRQRTRWTKGWAQTWLVHMRQPGILRRQIGLRNFVVFQLLFVGMLASALAHPVFLALAILSLASFATNGLSSAYQGLIFALDLFNAVGGYAAFIALSIGALDARERGVLVKYYPLLYLYWLLIAVAALRALGQLVSAPHQWEKTPHDIRSRADPGDARYRLEPHFGED